MWFKNWPFFIFKRKLIKWARSGIYISPDRAPETIRLSRNIWQVILEMKKNTGIDGAERGVSVLDIDGLMIITPTIIGESEKVLLRHQFKVEYQYEPATQRCHRFIYRDGRLIIKDYFLTKSPPSRINLSVLFHIHTHPSPEEANFFSLTDIKGFIEALRLPAMILVAKDIWLLLKSRLTPLGAPLKSNNSLEACRKNGLIVYRGGLSERLKYFLGPS